MNSDRSEVSADSLVSGSNGPGQYLDRVLPGPGGRVDRISLRLQDAYAAAGNTAVGRPIFYVLRGNAWLGHPAHPVMVTVPVGAWVVSSWYDLKSTRTGRSRDEHAADGALHPCRRDRPRAVRGHP